MRPHGDAGAAYAGLECSVLLEMWMLTSSERVTRPRHVLGMRLPSEEDWI